MKYCLISQEVISEGNYSLKALRKINSKLTDLKPLKYGQEQQSNIVKQQVGKISIDGFQPKFSVQLDLVNQTFKPVEKFGTYIIKPQNPNYSQLPENEAFTMLMARYFNLEVPLTGLIKCKDGSNSYFIKRFDRHGKNGKYMLEDFSQLAGMTRDTKYDYSVEKLIKLIDQYCTFSQVEKMKFFRLFAFNLLFGNEDMHLKNYSILTVEKRGKAVDQISPCYDLINSMASYRLIGKTLNKIEQSALTLNGKKRNFKYTDLLYLCKCLDLPNSTVEKCCLDLKKIAIKALEILDHSSMDADLKRVYAEVLEYNLPIFQK